METRNLTATLRRGLISATVLLTGALLFVGTPSTAFATENGLSTYPAGVDTVLPAKMPGPGKTTFFNYSQVYWANESDGSNGKSAVPEFKTRVIADAIRFVHNWGVPVLGGSLHTVFAQPTVTVMLHTPGGRGNETGIANDNLTLGVTYIRENVLAYYEFDSYFPGWGYNNTHMVNLGQHNWAFGPAAAVSYLPNHEHSELSAKFQYLANTANSEYAGPAGVGKYQGGNELTLEYDAMQKFAKHYSAGLNGFLFKQTTDDKLNGALVNGDGNRGRDFAIGPELRLHYGRFGGAFKYEREFLVENRSRGNQLWFQFAVPLGNLKKK
jgi:hypothetical protein